jgi:hypothetical protein
MARRRRVSLLRDTGAARSVFPHRAALPLNRAPAGELCQHVVPDILFPGASA